MFPPFKSIGSTTVSLSSKDKEKVTWQLFLPKSCGSFGLKKKTFEVLVGLGMFFGRILGCLILAMASKVFCHYPVRCYSFGLETLLFISFCRLGLFSCGRSLRMPFVSPFMFLNKSSMFYNI